MKQSLKLYVFNEDFSFFLKNCLFLYVVFLFINLIHISYVVESGNAAQFWGVPTALCSWAYSCGSR